MTLVDVYRHDGAVAILYRLLSEREPHQNISHKEMPEWRAHCAFVASKPYAAWYLIETDEVIPGNAYLPRAVAGAVHLTMCNEIGIHLFREFQRMKLGPAAINELMRLHPRKRFLANVNPDNEHSKAMFRRLGFKHIQETYELAC